MVGFVWYAVILQGQGASPAPLVPAPGVSHAHRFHQIVVRSQVVVCISVVALHTLITCQAQDSGTDGRPLCLGQGHRGEVVGQDVSAGHLVCLN